MVEIPQNTTQLVALLRRPGFGEALRFVMARDRPWRKSLSLKPEEMDSEVLRFSNLSVKLPRHALQGTQKMLLRKEDVPTLGTALRSVARLLPLYPELKGDPAALLTLARKLSRYQSIRDQSGRAINSALDLRLLLGALEWYMLRGLLVKVVERLEDPATPRAEAERLRARFSKLLLHKQALLMSREERARLVEQQRKDLTDQAAEVEKRTLVADVQEAIRQHRPIDDATMARAAQYNRELKAKDSRQTKR